MLNPDVARSIAERAMSVLPYNVNLMDSEGKIIATGEPDRLGTFHEGAARVLKTGSPLEISVEEARYLLGVRPGVNLPIRQGGRVVGVVGITGDPEEVRPFGELVRAIAELMLEQAEFLEGVYLETRAYDTLIRDLVLRPHETVDGLTERARWLGLDLRVPRLLILCSLSPAEPQDGEARERTVLVSERELTRLTTRVREEVLAPGDLTALLGDHLLLILKKYERSPTGNRDHAVQRAAAEKLHHSLHRHGVPANLLLVTPPVAEPGDYHPTYLQALEALTAARRLGLEKPVLHLHELGAALVVAHLPPSARRTMADLLAPLDTLAAAKQEELEATAHAFLADGLNLSRAARSLFIHRNTLAHRLNRIRSLTGLDLRHFEDAMRFRLAWLCREWQNRS